MGLLIEGVGEGERIGLKGPHGSSSGVDDVNSGGDDDDGSCATQGVAAQHA